MVHIFHMLQATHFDTILCDRKATELCWEVFDKANGMTDKAAGFAHLCDLAEDAPERQRALERFYKDANGDANVIDKWFQMQARADCIHLCGNYVTLERHDQV